ncbi:MAG: glycosyltransferase [Alphaproteobacteria bacterium]|nr:glycosyltransferase [Alphaproteobacteria bacterium]
MATPDATSGRAPAPSYGAPTVLQVIPTLEAGGAEQTTLDIASALVAAGGRALVASEGGRLEGALAAAGAKLIRLPVASKHPYTVLANALRLSQILDAYGVDIVHARSRAPAWSAYLAARATGRPFVTTYHGTYNARTALKRFYNSVMARGDRVIANSAFIAGRVEAAYPWAAPRLLAIPRGTDMRRFDPEAVDESRVAAVRRSWGLAERAHFDDPAIVLLPGRLTRWKGQLVLVEALARLREHGLDDFLCILAGDVQKQSDFLPELEALIARHDLKERVRLVGHCGDMPAAYLASDIVVSASIEPEAFGRVAVEAEAMGRPVIATDHGGTRETVVPYGEDYATGWRVEPDNADALATALSAALALGPDARLAMGVLGRLHVRETFALETMCRRTIDIYRDLAARRRAASGAAGPARARILVVDVAARGWSELEPSLAGIRAAHPTGEITLLTAPERVRRAWTSGLFDAVWGDGAPVGAAATLRLLARARRHRFARAYDLTMSPESRALVPMLAPRRNVEGRPA